MLKKIFKVFMIILVIGFISVFVRGFNYQTSKQTDVALNTENSSSKQELIDDDIITSLIGDDEEETEDTSSTNDITTSNVETSNTNNQSSEVTKETTINQNYNSNVETNNSISSNQNQEVSKKEVKETETTSNTNTSNSYIGVANPNDFYYSFHHGNIDEQYSDLNSCYADSARVAFKDTVDILNITCFEVLDSQGTVLGIYMYVNCQSGNCERYK